MHDSAHRFAVAVLFVCGALSAVMLPLDPQLAEAGRYGADSFGAWAVLQTEHRHFLVGLLGAALLLSAFVPALRLAAIGASIVSKLGYLALALHAAAPVLDRTPAIGIEVCMIVALAGAALIFAREARQDARWHGVRAMSPEA